MPRSMRFEYPGAFYHVMCRGDRREAIFADDRDREVFLRTLAEMCARTGQRVHSYVLMGNHYHLLLETPAANLVAGMKWFQGTYAQRHNARHRLCGHLFQGRYKAIPIESAATDYFRMVSEYIHLNPARAGMLPLPTSDLLLYPWSSFPVFARKAQTPPWLSRQRVFANLDLRGEGAAARRRYQGWMAVRTRQVLEQNATREQDEQWRELRRGWCLGSETFRDRLMDAAATLIAGHKRSCYGVREESLRRHDQLRAEELLSAGLRRLEISLEEAVALRHCDARKQALAWLVKSQTVVGDEWIDRKSVV